MAEEGAGGGAGDQDVGGNGDDGAGDGEGQKRQRAPQDQHGDAAGRIAHSQPAAAGQEKLPDDGKALARLLVEHGQQPPQATPGGAQPAQ